MSYQVLARKWRPKNFREMVGQEHVLQALINALDHDRLHHAYLFTGTRGVGKTTIARILAKCLNCESGVSSEPCGECSSCREIAEGRSVDLWEIDAASRTKVEDTRELLENVQYAPSHSRFKVYLIDEVHMLSSHSFNALLKTLEEPPPHVKFLLATTDPQKLPATVLSRCLQFNLKNMSPELVVGHLRHVLGQEMVSFEDPALWLLGRAADGSMRDALSLTDQAIAFGSGKLVETDVRNMLGSVDLSFVYQLLEEVVKGEPASLMTVVTSMAEHAPDFEASLVELISLIHRVALAQVVPDAIDNTWGDAERVGSIAQALSAEDAQLFYQVAINGKRDMAYAADPRSGFEMLLLRMIAFRPSAVLDESLTAEDLQAAPLAPVANVAREVGSPVKKSPEVSAAPAAAPQQERETSAIPIPGGIAAMLEGSDGTAGKTARQGASANSAPVAPEPAAVIPHAEPVMPEEAPPIADEDVPPWVSMPDREAAEVIEDVPPVALVDAPKAAISNAADQAQVAEPETTPGSTTEAQVKAAPTFALVDLTPESWPRLLAELGLLGIVYNIASHCVLQSHQGGKLDFLLDGANASLFNDGHTNKIRLVLQNYFDCELSVNIEKGTVNSETPAMHTARMTQQRQQQAVDAIERDPLLQQLIQRFDGELDRQSIRPLES